MLTILLSHFSAGSNDAIAPDFPAQVLGTRDDDLADTVNIKHKEGIYSKRAVTKASLSMGKKPFQKDNAGDWSGFVYFVASFFFSLCIHPKWEYYPFFFFYFINANFSPRCFIGYVQEGKYKIFLNASNFWKQ